jgi:hypothetical protein
VKSVDSGDSEKVREILWGAAVAALCDWHPPLSINADKVVGTPEKGGVK